MTDKDEVLFFQFPYIIPHKLLVYCSGLWTRHCFVWLFCKINENNNEFSVQAVKINKWDGAAAKNAIDDAIREVHTNRYTKVLSDDVLSCFFQ